MPSPRRPAKVSSMAVNNDDVPPIPVPPVAGPAPVEPAPAVPSAAPHPPTAPVTPGAAAAPQPLPPVAPPARPDPYAAPPVQTGAYAQPGAYAQQPGPAQPGYAAYTPMPAGPPQGLSLASMITGIAAVLLSFGSLGFLPAVAAVILGHLGQRRQPYARPFWLTGLVTGYIALGISLIWGLIVLLSVLAALTSNYY